MAVTYNDFIARFPDFSSGPAAVVNIELAHATQRVNAAAFGEQTDDAIGLLTAHRMALQPGGEFARLKSQDGMSHTTFGDLFQELANSVVPGDRVP